MSEDRLEFITVKGSRYKKRPQIQMFRIPLSNSFEGLTEESEEPVCQLNVNPATKGTEWKKIKFPKRRKNVVINQTTCPPYNGRNKLSLSQFETANRYQGLDDIPDECIENNTYKVGIMKIAKQGLKKCRFCNFKKRSCQIYPENCQAKKKVCWNCKKQGKEVASDSIQTQEKTK